MPPPRADSTVAIPWFTNIWVNEGIVQPRQTPRPTPTPSASVSRSPSQTSAPTSNEPTIRLRSRSEPSPALSQPHSHSSSHQTISTMSAVDRVSLCSLPSTVHQCSAQDILRTLSDSNSAQDLNTIPVVAETDTQLALQMHLLRMRSTSINDSPNSSSRRVNPPPAPTAATTTTSGFTSTS